MYGDPIPSRPVPARKFLIYQYLGGINRERPVASEVSVGISGRMLGFCVGSMVLLGWVG